MLIDTHTHLNHERFASDCEEIINTLKSKGVDLAVICGDNLSGSKKALDLAEKHDNLYCTLGVHPHEANYYNEETESFVLKNASNKKVVAIGEIGLDYHYEFSPREVQKEVLVKQIKLAYQLKLPIVFHVREAAADFLEILQNNKKYLKYGGVIHSFSGSLEEAKIYIDYGFMIGVVGILTFKDADILRETVKAIDISKLVLETDCPYLAPMPQRGKRNEPAFIVHTAKKLCEIKNLGYAEVCEITAKNALRLFGKIKEEL